MTDKYLVTVPNKFPIHEPSGGLRHGKGGRIFVPDLPHEGKSEQFGDWAEIRFGSGVDYGP